MFSSRRGETPIFGRAMAPQHNEAMPEPKLPPPDPDPKDPGPDPVPDRKPEEAEPDVIDTPLDPLPA